MSNRIRFAFTFVVPFLLLLVSGSGPVVAGNPPAPTYAIIDLGTLGGLSSIAKDINVRGQVVGHSSTAAAGGAHAFLWEAGTGMQDLGTLGGPYSGASGINALGQIVGYSSTAAGGAHAFLWEAGTGMQDLGTLGGLSSIATAINAQGQVVGVSDYAGGTTGSGHAFLWAAGTGMQDLGALAPGVSSAAYGINARGQVVGSSSTAGFREVHAFLWEPGAGMQDLGTPPNSWSAAYGINAQGQVVGYSEGTGRPPAWGRGFLWEAGTGMQDLGDLGGGVTRAEAINARGQVVGWSSTAAVVTPIGVIGGEYHAFLWEAGTGVQDLGTLGGTYSRASGMNARGQIVGESATGEYAPSHAVLWEPMPASILISIDIKPGGLPNSINSKSHGSIPVAILSSASFDAPTEVNVTSLTFGRTGSEASLRFCSPTGEDVNADGFLDMVCHFNTQATGFLPGDVVGALKGRTLSDVLIEGTDSVNIVK